MLQQLSHLLRDSYTRIVNSMAYYPVLISLLLGVLSLILLNHPDNALDQFLAEHFKVLQKLEGSAARDLLGVVTAGAISIAVFSFSMVMMVLSQGANTYSPKILDGLIKDKRPQRTIGIFVGTVVFCLPHLLSSSMDEPGSLSAILLAVVLAITNMFIFIGFIHYVSQSIKPSEICRRIYQQAAYRPYEELKLKRGARLGHTDAPDTSSWTSLLSARSGYFQRVDLQELYDLCEKHELQICLTRQIGDYMLKGVRLAAVCPAEAISDEIREEILATLHFYTLEDVSQNPYYAYRQLTEVGTKAMSPGVNDIGTARIALDFLSKLIGQYVEQPWYSSLKNAEGRLRLWLNPIRLHQLFEWCLDEIRIYCLGDKFMLMGLLQACRNLLEAFPDELELKQELQGFTKKIVADLKESEMSDQKELKVYYEHYLKQKLA